MELLVDAPEFTARLEADIAAARESILLQTLSFEADAAGSALANRLSAATAPDRRVIVDSFTRFFLSGKFLYRPGSLLDGELRREARATRAMLEKLRRNGVGLRFSNPVGWLLRRLPARNHKKTVIIDDRIAYVGGINFSDHNFAWHDLMLRIDDPAAARFLARDFEDTWQGQPASRSATFPGLELHVLNGASNPAGFVRVFELIRGARRAITVQSAYLSFPFCEHLRRARRRGVHVTGITPELNTIDSLRRYILWEGRRSGFEIRLYPGRMSHVKAMLIDDEVLVAGSSNFDYLSYRLHQEVIAVVSEPGLVSDFRSRVAAPDTAISPVPTAAATPRPAPGLLLHGWLRFVGALLILAGGR